MTPSPHEMKSPETPGRFTKPSRPKLRAVLGLTAVLTCGFAWFVLDICSQVYGVSWNVSLSLSRYPVWYGDANRCDARSQGREEVRDQGCGQSRVGGLPAAAHVPRRDEGAARDAAEPVGAAAGDPGSGTGLFDRSGSGCSRAGPGGDRFPPARARRCGPRPGQGAGPAGPTGAGTPGR